VGNWRAAIRRKGASFGKTFRLKVDAQAWADENEARLEGGATYKLRELAKTTVGDIVESFMREVVPHRKGKRWEENRCYAFQRAPWARLNMLDDIQGPLMVWCDNRLAGVGGRKVAAATVNRDLNC
jgi:hypothetical protein